MAFVKKISPTPLPSFNVINLHTKKLYVQVFHLENGYGFIGKRNFYRMIEIFDFLFHRIIESDPIQSIRIQFKYNAFYCIDRICKVLCVNEVHYTYLFVMRTIFLMKWRQKRRHQNEPSNPLLSFNTIST